VKKDIDQELLKTRYAVLTVPDVMPVKKFILQNQGI
jgi:hypothetical protein